MLNGIIMGLVRQALVGAGVYIASKGILDQGTVDNVIGALMTIAGAGWMAYVKIAEKKA